MIDSHCHLAGAEFAADLDAVVARAREAGLVRCLVILARRRRRGVRPGGARDGGLAGRAVRDRRPSAPGAQVCRQPGGRRRADRQSAATLLPAACAIGEIGLDYHYDFSPRDVQQAVFRAQLRLARDRAACRSSFTRAKPKTTRCASSTRNRSGRLRGVFHCFSGDAAAARRARWRPASIVSIPGHRDVSEGRRSCATRRATCRATAC